MCKFATKGDTPTSCQSARKITKQTHTQRGRNTNCAHSRFGGCIHANVSQMCAGACGTRNGCILTEINHGKNDGSASRKPTNTPRKNPVPAGRELFCAARSLHANPLVQSLPCLRAPVLFQKKFEKHTNSPALPFVSLSTGCK